jgi:hypothetical protein
MNRVIFLVSEILNYFEKLDFYMARFLLFVSNLFDELFFLFILINKRGQSESPNVRAWHLVGSRGNTNKKKESSFLFFILRFLFYFN